MTHERPQHDDIASLLFSFVRKVSKNVRTIEQGEHISLAHLKTLYVISEHSLPTMKDIAHYFGITPPSATAMVNKFVKEGYIKRAVSDVDRRTIHLELTSRGKEQLVRSTKLMTEKTNELMNVLSDTEKKEFARIMKKIIDN